MKSIFCKWLLVLIVWAAVLRTDAANIVNSEASRFPEGAVTSGLAHVEGDCLVCDKTEFKVGFVSRPGKALLIEGRAGKDPRGFSMELTLDGTNAPISWSISAKDYTFAMGERGFWCNIIGPSNTTLSQAFLELPWGVKYFTRPNPWFYELPKQKELAAQWDHLKPAAGDALFRLTLKPRDTEVEFWIDERFVSTQPLSNRISRIAVSLSTGSALRVIRWVPLPESGSYLPIPLEAYARPGALTEGTVSLEPGLHDVGKVPFKTVGMKDHVDVGLSACLLRNDIAMEDPYYDRSAFDGVPETIVFSVPRKQYIRAHFLCAVEKTPSKSPTLTARLTRYVKYGRGDAVADTTVVLPQAGEAPPPGVSQVGTVTYVHENQTNEVPLWFVTIPLKIGQIQDLLVEDDRITFPYGLPHDHFDVELMGALRGGEGFDALKPKPQSSAVHVFALTLEESPVTFLCRSKQAGHIFYRSEHPAFQLSMTNNLHTSGRYAVQWTYNDYEGRQFSGRKKVRFRDNDTALETEIPADVPDVGWYKASLRLVDDADHVLVDYRTTFAILPPDSRQAGYESPFGTWWFGYAHRCGARIDLAGPLMQRAGFRHTPIFYDAATEKDMAPYKITLTQIDYHEGKPDQPVDQWLAECKPLIAKCVSNYPHCTQALIFHETYLPNCVEDVPAEIYGGQPDPLTPPQQKKFDILWERAMALSRYYRETYPHIRLVFGNGGNATPICEHFFRKKYPKEYIDYLGSETLCYDIIPERGFERNIHANWLLKETARKFGYGDIPLTACFEWIGRSERRIGLKTQADWLVRDALLAMAYGFNNVCPSLLCDVGNAYYHNVYGAGGLCRRFPLLNPKPSYVALATLTQVLDGARYSKAIETGSDSLYALEFQGRKELIYALWTVRGTREVSLCFAENTAYLTTDMMGRERKCSTRKAKDRLWLGTGPLFIKSPVALRQVVPGKSLFPEEIPPANYQTLNRLDALSAWTLQESPDPQLQFHVDKGGHRQTLRPDIPWNRPGKMALTGVKDTERGQCLELTLIPEGNIPSITGEYTLLKLKKPVPVSGKPNSFGVWVKGNSGWGWVMLEYTDANGKQWFSGGLEAEMFDWPGFGVINFDGWNFLRMQIMGKPRYPISVSGIAVVMRRQNVCVTEMKPVRNMAIRLHDLVSLDNGLNIEEKK